MKHTIEDESAALSVDQVSKSYGALLALSTVSLAVAAGEFVALLGPNGAGKTTLFQLLSGLFAADAGSLGVNGKDIRLKPEAALSRLGIVFQQPTLDLDLTVSANLRFHARLHGMRRSTLSERIRQELDRLGLAQDTETVCRNLSGGNRRKVELARALLHEPDLLLMDEATVGLDPASRRSLLDYVHELCEKRDMGVLWATHLVDEAERANHIVILHQGKCIARGTPEALRELAEEADLSDAFLQLTGIRQNNGVD